MNGLIVASNLSDEAKERLISFGYEILEFNINKSVNRNIAHHADLSFFDCCDGTLVIAREMEIYKTKLESYGYNVKILPYYLGKDYPKDVSLNCVIAGEYLICNINTVAKEILEYFSDKKIVNVHQGYTKCSIVVVNEHALITDDRAIAKQCSDNGIDVLEISKGSVILNGFAYGFIGGTAGKLSDTEIAFNGNVMTHSDGMKIVKFLEKHNITAVSLCNEQLCDIGSIIVLKRRNKDEKK